MLGHLVYSRHALDEALPAPLPAGWLARFFRMLFRGR